MDINAFNGIILYDIGLNGCLNGVYTNMEAPAGVIYNEIARKKGKFKATGSDWDIEGVYVCQFFTGENERSKCELTITKEKGKNGYAFEWKEKDAETYYGRGYQMNPRQIAVHYGA